MCGPRPPRGFPKPELDGMSEEDRQAQDRDNRETRWRASHADQRHVPQEGPWPWKSRVHARYVNEWPERQGHEQSREPEPERRQTPDGSRDDDQPDGKHRERSDELGPRVLAIGHEPRARDVAEPRVNRVREPGTRARRRRAGCCARRCRSREGPRPARSRRIPTIGGSINTVQTPMAMSPRRKRRGRFRSSSTTRDPRTPAEPTAHRAGKRQHQHRCVKLETDASRSERQRRDPQKNRHESRCQRQSGDHVEGSDEPSPHPVERRAGQVDPAEPPRDRKEPHQDAVDTEVRIRVGGHRTHDADQHGVACCPRVQYPEQCPDEQWAVLRSSPG